MLVVTVTQGLFAINLLLHFGGCSFFPRLNHRSKTTSNCLTGLQQLWGVTQLKIFQWSLSVHPCSKQQTLDLLCIVRINATSGENLWWLSWKCSTHLFFPKDSTVLSTFLILLTTDKNLWRPGKEFSLCISWAFVQHHSSPI